MMGSLLSRSVLPIARSGVLRNDLTMENPRGPLCGLQTIV